MCAINPVHKKRLILDVYTSDRRASREEFMSEVVSRALRLELELNSQVTSLRWHVKETEQEAD
jgi:hypothetical protein